MDVIEYKQLKIEALKYAQLDIKAGREYYICYALSQWVRHRDYDDVGYEVMKSLRRYISTALGGQPTYERWAHCYVHQYMTHQDCKNARIAWIDWMIACLQEDIDNLKRKGR